MLTASQKTKFDALPDDMDEQALKTKELLLTYSRFSWTDTLLLNKQRECVTIICNERYSQDLRQKGTEVSANYT